MKKLFYLSTILIYLSSFNLFGQKPNFPKLPDAKLIKIINDLDPEIIQKLNNSLAILTENFYEKRITLKTNPKAKNTLAQYWLNPLKDAGSFIGKWSSKRGGAELQKIFLDLSVLNQQIIRYYDQIYMKFTEKIMGDSKQLIELAKNIKQLASMSVQEKAAKVKLTNKYIDLKEEFTELVWKFKEFNKNLTASTKGQLAKIKESFNSLNFDKMPLTTMTDKAIKDILLDRIIIETEALIEYSTKDQYKNFIKKYVDPLTTIKI